MLQQAAERERAQDAKREWPDVSGFLVATPVWELKHIRRLSALCGLTYKTHLVTVS